MTPELHRALVPKITMARLVSNHVKNAFTGITLVNLWTKMYLDAMQKFFGEINAGNLPADPPANDSRT